MNDIMQVNEVSKTMSSREMAELCGKEHRNVLSLIRLLVERGVLKNSIPQNYFHEQNGQQYTEFLSDQRDSLVIVARLSPEFTAAVIDRWQELEQQVSASQPVIALPQDYLSALKALVNSEEEKQVAQAQVIELKPKAEALARISQSAGATNIRDTAKAVGMRQNDFVAWCVDDTKPVSRRFMYRDDRGVLNAYSHRTSAGLMTQKLQSFVGHDGRDRAEPRVKFTPAGVAKIAEMLEKERNREAELV